ncbi:MAG: HAD hydrolase-like protein, partial [Chloroflexi bacterium]|nr:HAD hydrolase-like protein [Chloroflexota bacterium]
HLRDAGYRLAVFSNARYAPFVHWALDSAGLTPYLHLIESSDGIGWRKPSIPAFEFVLDRLGVVAHEAVYVGDYYPFDIVGAKAAGMGTIWLERSYSPTGPAADATVEALPDVIPVLQRWQQEKDAT